ncbi:MAG: hypothetical protein ACUVRD_02365 [Bacteroidia bacterium]
MWRNTFLPIAFFALFSVFYFAPYLQGYRLSAGDQTQGFYARTFFHEHGFSFWHPNLFSGMPTYFIYTSPADAQPMYLDVRWLMVKIFRNYPMMIFFVGLLGMFIFLRTWQISSGWATVGALGFVLMSYYTVMIVATHFGKSNVIFTLPYLLAGQRLLHLRRWGWGTLLASIGLYGIFSGEHPQMAYYGGFVVAAWEVYYLWEAWQKKNLLPALGASFTQVFLAMGAFFSMAHILLPRQEYTFYSIRGPNPLVREVAKDPSQKTGLERSYAQSYSLSRSELFSLIIPHYVGGTSDEDVYAILGKRSALYQALKQNGVEPRSILQRIPLYWGGLPFSSGGFYVGVGLFFLSILGFLYVRQVWAWLLGYVVLLVLLLGLGAYSFSWWASSVLLCTPAGLYILYRHRPGKLPMSWVVSGGLLVGALLLSAIDSDPQSSYKITDAALDFLPLYNKFRAPSTFLVVVGYIIPFLAVWGISQFVLSPDKNRFWEALGITVGVLGVGIGLGFSGVYDFQAESDAQIAQQVPGWFMDALRDDRRAILWQEGLRSLLVVGLIGLGLWSYAQKWLPKLPICIFVALVSVGEILLVTRRYIGKENYEKDLKFSPPPKERHEEIILTRGTLGRVYPMHTATFVDSRPAAYLEDIGGYSPAKLRRYQIFIENHLSQLHLNPLRMLDTRYYLYARGRPTLGFLPVDTAGPVRIEEDPFAYGPAWLVEKVEVLPTPDAVLDTLDKVDSRKVAFLEAWQNPQTPPAAPLDTSEGVVLLERKPELLRYKVKAQRARFLVMSEVHYPPDWHAYVNGQETPIYYTNFILRGLAVGPGESEVVVKLEPRTYQKGKIYHWVGTALLWLLTLGSWGYEYFARRRT